MKVATAGIGLRAGHLLSILKEMVPETEFSGFYDPQPSHLAMIGADVPRFSDVRQMLRETKPDIFFVCSPNRFHLEQIRIGLESDIEHIFAEKPVVISVEETFQLARLLAEHGTDRLIVGLVLRYSSHMVDLAAAMADGALGQIASLEASEHIGPYHGAFFMRDWRRMAGNSGGFMLEKCCHDLDLYNMMTASRPRLVASFGGRRSFLPDNAPVSNSESGIFHIKKSVWDSTDDPFRSDGDIIDFQTAILSYESGASLAFHTNLNVPDEHRRFLVIGSHGMAEGDFMRGYLKITRRDGSVYASHDYTRGGEASVDHHYGADQMMIGDILSYLRGETRTLPVSIVDALEAGLAALALDHARKKSQVADLTEIWARFDSFGLRR